VSDNLDNTPSLRIYDDLNVASLLRGKASSPFLTFVNYRCGIHLLSRALTWMRQRT